MQSEDTNEQNGYSYFPPSYEHLESRIGQSISAQKLKDHIELLLQPVDSNQPDINGFDIEFNYIENKTAQDLYFGDYKSAVLPANRIKNRYTNVLPPERTRVLLKPEHDEEGSDYINANYISGLIPGRDRAYVATQGPLQTTFSDFWRMVWELSVTVIIMLTKEIENGRLKCDRYWPEADAPLTVGYFRIKLVNAQETPELTVRTLEVTNFEENETRVINQFQYTAWPDHGLPVSTTAFLELAHNADKANPSKAPMVVHCSAGIGRSGTFCAVHSTIEKFKQDLEEEPTKEKTQDPEVNVVKTVLYLREQRPGMVQTKDQYMFCYLAIQEEAEKILQEKGIVSSNQKNDLHKRLSIEVLRKEEEHNGNIHLSNHHENH